MLFLSFLHSGGIFNWGGGGGGNHSERNGGTNNGGVVDDMAGGVGGHMLLDSGEGVELGVGLVSHGGHMLNNGGSVSGHSGGNSGDRVVDSRGRVDKGGSGSGGIYSFDLSNGGGHKRKSSVNGRMDGSSGVAEEKGISFGVGLTLLSGLLNSGLFSGNFGGFGNGGNEGESCNMSETEAKTVSIMAISKEGRGIGDRWGLNFHGLDNRSGVDQRSSGVGEDGSDNGGMDNGLSNGVDETILVQIFGESFQSVRTKALGGGDEVSEGSGEGSGGGTRCNVDLVDGGWSSQAGGSQGENNEALHRGAFE